MTSKSFIPFAIALSFLAAVSACSPAGDTSGGDSETSSASIEGSESSTPVVSTPNVRYVGTLEKEALSASSEGTHTLTLSDGQILLLESTDDNLDLMKYEGKRVEIRGSAQAAADGNGTLLRVTEVILLEASSESSSEESSSSAISSSQGKMCGGIAGIACDAGQACVDEPSDSCDPDAGGADCSGMCVTTLASSSSVSPSSSSAVSVAPSSVPSSVSSPSPSSASVSSVSSISDEKAAAMETQVATMAKQNYAESSSWTQKYCTGHIGFCIAVHKNWYFKSFGATTSNAWHVEFGLESIDELGDGAIVLNLVSGSSASMQASSGQLKSIGSDVIGFLDWTDGRHFELIADERLRSAVEYMLQSIVSYEPAS